MGEALGQVYVARYFPPEEKQQTLAMTLAIERAMEKEIDGLDWMSAATKIRAKEKLHAVMNKIGYPEKWRDYSKLILSAATIWATRCASMNLTWRATWPRSASQWTRTSGR